jgi:ribosomal protein S3
MISIFTRYLSKSLSLENKHRKVLWAAVNAITLLSIKLPLFKGIRIYVTGKLNGKMRRKTYSFKLGRLSIQQIDSNLDYFKATSFTKFGTLSVKV